MRSAPYEKGKPDATQKLLLHDSHNSLALLRLMRHPYDSNAANRKAAFHGIS